MALLEVGVGVGVLETLAIAAGEEATVFEGDGDEVPMVGEEVLMALLEVGVGVGVLE
eukprot:CAMPEP_0184348168 /NCGR_PEP_ID=MMETSP1089-20130417/25086_1 /TAXON_ID=38269 ORGANISM="Gloeochaete wittrockiana, Strain SAG46.84" /NCGR_SAMPLE_ID=MMETSP1089 /ASSEMBLY_ACC=CAM_ASM_000445 /LENGTH=56 /DNA_ID=CAMNT_0026679729 /DNA_START=1 /DNA_END=168 /DNA_ORIENTATION=-